MLFCGGVQGPRRRNREKAILVTIFIIGALYFLFFAKTSEHRKYVSQNPVSYEGSQRSSHSGQASPSSVPKSQTLEKDLVVASMMKDDVSWLYDNFPEWHKSIYVVDDKQAKLTVDLNKGRESMVYLT